MICERRRQLLILAFRAQAACCVRPASNHLLKQHGMFGEMAQQQSQAVCLSVAAIGSVFLVGRFISLIVLVLVDENMSFLF